MSAKKPKASRPQRPRAVVRERDREQKKLSELVVKLDALEPGGSPSNPIVLGSAAEVEITAESKPCPACQGSLRVTDHDVTEHQGQRLRAVRLVCRACHAKWARFFRLGPWLS